MTSSYEFLAEVHDILKPPVYLEVGVVGVFNGASLQLATHSQKAIGIDPQPFNPTRPNQQLYRMTSDEYFMYEAAPDLRIDMAYIDGSHHFEDALRDFINIEHHSHKGTVVLFDDVLPYSQEVGQRDMVPGHWAGDVWKVRTIIAESRPDLQVYLVDTDPTGTLVVWDLDPINQVLPNKYDWFLDWREINEVPQSIIERTFALTPAAMLETLREVSVTQ